MEKTYVVRIFDGTYTSVYTTQDLSEKSATEKICMYHKILGGTVVKVTTTEQRR